MGTPKPVRRIFGFFVMLGNAKTAIAGAIWFVTSLSGVAGVLSAAFHFSTLSVWLLSIATALLILLIGWIVLWSIRRPQLEVVPVQHASWATFGGGELGLDASVLLTNTSDRLLIANAVTAAVPTASGLRKRSRRVDGRIDMRGEPNIGPNETERAMLSLRVPNVASLPAKVNALVFITDQHGRPHRNRVVFKSYPEPGATA